MGAGRLIWARAVRPSLRNVDFGAERYRVASVSWQSDGPGQVPTSATIHLQAVDPIQVAFRQRAPAGREAASNHPSAFARTLPR